MLRHELAAAAAITTLFAAGYGDQQPAQTSPQTTPSAAETTTAPQPPQPASVTEAGKLVLDHVAKVLHYPYLADTTVQAKTYFAVSKTNTSIQVANTTSTPIPELTEATLLDELVFIDDKMVGQSFSADVDVPNGLPPQKISYELSDGLSAHNQFIIVSPKAPMVASAEKQQASFTSGPGSDERVSIIFESQGNDTLLPIPQNDVAATTEICQQTLQVRDTNTPSVDTKKLLQEAFCNGFGFALAAKRDGISYADYAQALSIEGVRRNGYATRFFVAPSDLYAQLPVS